ncbi:serine hydrolase domain-containing protein [Undibacterium arcticum]
MKQIASRMEAILSRWNRNDAPGCVVSVIHKGRTVLRKGYGMASLEQQVANSPSTKMRIGSTTKHFAAILALQLRDEGLLDIDGPCVRYLPELREAQGRRSLRQFMNHTGGTRDFLDLSMFSNGAAMLPAGAALAYQSAQEEDNFRAGDMFSYNNGGYRMLSIAIERVLHMPFAQALETRLFGPLGMYDTSLWACDHDLLPGVACSHVALPDGGFRRGVFPSTILGEGGIVSTVDDMQRWLAHLRKPHLWADALSAELTQPTTLNNGFLHPYGLGLIRENYRGVEIIQHSGGVIGGSCQMLTAPRAWAKHHRHQQPQRRSGAVRRCRPDGGSAGRRAASARRAGRDGGMGGAPRPIPVRRERPAAGGAGRRRQAFPELRWHASAVGVGGR